MSRTTIAISHKTHHDLIQIAAQLTLRDGERCSMDKAISECIQAYHKPHRRVG